MSLRDSLTLDESSILIYRHFECADDIQLIDDSTEIITPPWVDFFIAIGAWCRRNQIKNKRLITVVVVPTRELASGFSALGSLMEGAKAFEDSLSWPTFRSLPLESIVHWKQKVGKSNFSGKILGFENISGTEFISLEVTKPAAIAKKGLVQKVSKNHFDSYLFTTEPPVNSSKVFSMAMANNLLSSWIGSISPKWVWADGAECLIVTSMSRFEKDFSDISITCDGQQPISVLDLLCLGNNNDATHSKLRISHSRGCVDGKFPLIILDGPDAFHLFVHSSNSSNLLIILERGEYLNDIHGTVLQMRSYGAECLELLNAGLPSIIPAGIDFSAYTVDY